MEISTKILKRLYVSFTTDELRNTYKCVYQNSKSDMLVSTDGHKLAIISHYKTYDELIDNLPNSNDLTALANMDLSESKIVDTSEYYTNNRFNADLLSVLPREPKIECIDFNFATKHLKDICDLISLIVGKRKGYQKMVNLSHHVVFHAYNSETNTSVTTLLAPFIAP